MTALLELRGLTVDAGATRLVHGLDLAIGAGERVGLIGESGSGKSLTALAATGLLPAGLRAGGSARLGGVDVVGTPDRRLDPLRGTVSAMVFQEPLTALDPLMPVGRQIARPLARRAARDGAPLPPAALRAGVLDLMAEVALPEPARLARAIPSQMSGGQRQRVAIAMALACRPQLLIADEPTTALDVTTQAEILRLIDRLVTERGMALLFITHDLPVVAGAVDRVVVLQQGHAVETGPVATVFASPSHPYTKGLLAAARRFDDALEVRA